MRLKNCLLTATTGALLFLGGAATAEARPDRNCSARINREVNKLEREIRRHGFFSRQAQQRRIKIDRMRQQCGFAGLWGRGRDDRSWQRQNRNRGWSGRHRDGWVWDGRRWRRR